MSIEDKNTKMEFESIWDENEVEEVGFLEGKFAGFDPCMKYEPLTTAELKRRRLNLRRADGVKQIRVYEV